MTLPMGSVVGIIGGGQLGQMLCASATSLGFRTHVFTPDADSPARINATSSTVAEYHDQKALKAFAKAVDVITFEFENIPAKSMEFLASHHLVRPSPHALYISQHRVREKEFLQRAGVPTARFKRIESSADLETSFEEFGGIRAILKTAELGYDGKGQVIIDLKTDLKKIHRSMKVECILEEFIPFEKEVSVIVARNVKGEMRAFPVTENSHKGGILRHSKAPAEISESVARKATEYARTVASELDIVGLLTLEMFVLEDGTVLANEIAPRPHNSGHWTMDGCVTSQFEQHIRAVAGLPLGSTEMMVKVEMENLIGKDVERVKTYFANPEAKVHLYGKKEVREGRKMGHVNWILSTPRAKRK